MAKILLVSLFPIPNLALVELYLQIFCVLLVYIHYHEGNMLHDMYTLQLNKSYNKNVLNTITTKFKVSNKFFTGITNLNNYFWITV